MFAIRPASAADTAALAALDVQCNPAPWSAALFQAALNAGCDTVLVAESASQILGFIVWRQLADEAELHLIATAPACRRKGVAAALLAELFQAAAQNGVRRLFLEVRASNRAAQALYRKHGFAATATRPRYYGGSEDAVLMEKQC